MSPREADGRLSSHRLQQALAQVGASVGPVRVLEEVESTNDEVRGTHFLADSDWALVVADTQTAGRGRRGRVWSSPAGVNLYLSLLSPKVADPRQWSRLPILIATAAAEVLAAYACGVRVKWPNDLMGGNGFKLGGILVEAAGGRAVIGMGINVHAGAAALPPGATSLALDCPEIQWERPDLAAQLVAGVQQWWLRLREEGFPPIAKAWQGHALWLGEDVRVAGEAGDLAGRMEGIDEWGRLRLATAGGEHRLAAGEVSLRRRK